MSEARSFINLQAQSYESLKAGTPMSANQRAKFDVLNAHIVNSVVVGGELVIVGDPSTPSCTSHEAYLMAEAAGIHHQLEINGAGVDGKRTPGYRDASCPGTQMPLRKAFQTPRSLAEVGWALASSLADAVYPDLPRRG